MNTTPLLDELVETYVRWREECERVRHAYALWNQADGSDSAAAFAAYREALDREELAARSYSESCVRGTYLTTRGFASEV